MFMHMYLRVGSRSVPTRDVCTAAQAHVQPNHRERFSLALAAVRDLQRTLPYVHGRAAVVSERREAESEHAHRAYQAMTSRTERGSLRLGASRQSA